MINSYSLRFKSASNRIPELVKEREFQYQTGNLSTPDDVVDLVNSIFNLGTSPEEHLVVIGCRTNGSVCGIFDTSHGSANGSIVDPKAIFTRLLLAGATGFFLVHNHPSGDPTPSREDYAVTKRLAECADLMNIRFLDHIVIGATGFRSGLRVQIFSKRSKYK